MKHFICIAAFLFSATAFAQEKVEEKKETAPEGINIRCGGSGTVFFIDGVKKRGLHTEEYFVLSTPVIQPTKTFELPNGTMPLSKDLPYVHTTRGVVYTADHLRYAPRY